MGVMMGSKPGEEELRAEAYYREGKLLGSVDK